MRGASGISEPLGVYIHWPFCAQKCPYCDFNSHVRFGGWDEARFLAAYKRELDYVAGAISFTPSPRGPLHMQAQSVRRGDDRTVTSIFFGGGTPSLMKPETVGGILDHIAKLWPVAPDAEITIEANPGSVEASRFRGYRAAGANRVSMGLQSLRDAELKKLGRIHTVEEAKAALAIAAATFERYSFDLIYARPGQTPDQWRDELAEALEMVGDHVSLYQLTIEPETPYAALHAVGKLVVPDPDAALALYEITQEMTAAKGLAAYEISNHALPGAESRHNLLYWRYGEYAGIGPGAHGRLLMGIPGRGVGGDPESALGRIPVGAAGQKARVATVAERNPENWAARVEEHGRGYVDEMDLTAAEEADEMLLMGLRLSEGVELSKLVRTGVAPSRGVLAELRALGLIEILSGDGDAARSGLPPATHSREEVTADWRSNELAEIPLCLGPGLAPQTLPSPGTGLVQYATGTDMNRAGLSPRAGAIRDSLPPRGEGQGEGAAGGLAAMPGLRIRATPRGRFVLNAVVAKLSQSFEPVALPGAMDKPRKSL